MTWSGVGASGQFKTVNHDGNVFRGDYEEARGDVSGVIDSLVVIRLQGRQMSPLAPVSGQMLAWNGISWIPTDTDVLVSGVLSHNLLSATHLDTTPSSPVPGDLITAATGVPSVWTRFPIGTIPKQALSVSDSLSLEWRDPNVIPPLIVTSGTTVNLLDINQRVIVVKPSGSATTVNLPTLPALGQEVVIKDGKGDAGLGNYIDIVPSSGITIDGFPSIRLSVNYGAFTFIWNGTEWNII
jgi:hypothetical protein